VRDLLLRIVVAFGVSAALITELLGAFHLLAPIPLGIAWLVTIILAARKVGQAFSLPKRRPIPLPEAATAIAITGILAIVALTALLSPPNSADAMAYHLPRVLYWAQAKSVAFFPTPYFNQVMLQPLAEYLMLHTYLLTGGDRLVNLLACIAFGGCIVGVSAIAAAFGLRPRAQAITALVCATLPNAILQASGAKNDMLLALWLVCAAYFAIRRDAMWLGLSAGLALATKGTAYLFLPPILLAIAIPRRRDLAWIAAGALLINTPQYIRNIRLSGSPLGYDSAHGDSFFRWRNEHPGWRPMVSNALRHTSEQLGARSAKWNRSVYNTVVGIHRALGIDPEDPDTTWRWSHYDPPTNARNHEANANNRWHLLLMLCAAVWAVVKRDRPWMRYAVGLATAFLLFCFYLKWQPYMTRLELPLFILATPLAAWLLDRWRPQWLALLLCAFLVNNTRAALFENWTRPLKGPQSLWTSRRDDDYFRDMGQFHNQEFYVESVDRVAQSGCDLVGIDISEFALEYPFQVLLRERRPQVRFVHTGVPGAESHPCAVLCLECAGKEKKVAMYSGVGPPVEIGRFMLFLK
jgi:hypothetical protein